MGLFDGREKRNSVKTPRRLGELLIAAGAITDAELQRGIELQKGSNKRLGTILQEEGIITECNPKHADR